MIDKNGFEIRKNFFTGERVCYYHRQSGVKEVSIPEGVTRIGSNAFNGCEQLRHIGIPSTVTSIGAYAFSGCYNLKSITVPASVSDIGQGVFEWCTNLERLDIESCALLRGEISVLVLGCKHLNHVAYDGIVMEIEAKGIFCSVMYAALLCTLAGDRIQESKSVPEDIFYDVVLQAFLKYPQDEKWVDYITRHSSDMFRNLIDRNQITLLKSVLDTGIPVKEKVIRDLMMYANETRKYEMQILLTEFKKNHIGYEPEENILKKFEL